MNVVPTSLPLLCLSATLLLGEPAEGPGQPAPTAGDEVTFARDVAPIVFANCTSCHRPGQSAPFPLTNYEETRRRGRMIRLVTESRLMPPWKLVGGHGRFVGDRRMSEEDIATLAAWVEGGMPEGDRAATPPLPDFPDGWQLGEPDVVVSMPEAFEVPAGGPDILRSFHVPLGLEEDRWLAGIEVRAGDGGVLHHVFVNVDVSGEAAQLDGADGAPGFDVWAGRAPTIRVGGWAVGGTPSRMPLGLAKRLPKGGDLVLRSHLHPVGKEASERTTLGLFFADEPPTRTAVGMKIPPYSGMMSGLDIPAGDPEFTLSSSFRIPVDAQLLVLAPHAHYLCTEVELVAIYPDGKRDTLLLIDDWSFNWQDVYRFEEPFDVPAGTVLDVRIEYDNSADNPYNPHDPPRRVTYGQQSTDEMGTVNMVMVARVEEQTPQLMRAFRKYSSIPGVARADAISKLRLFDTDGDGRIAVVDIPENFADLVGAFDKNRDGIIDAGELEVAR